MNSRPPSSCRIEAGKRHRPVGRHKKFRARRELFGIRPDDRRRHLAIIGKTGMGKTTLLQQAHRVRHRAPAGAWPSSIPTATSADAILDAVPPSRTNDVVLFDAGDRDFPLAFNPLACRDPHQRPLVASGVVSAFKKLYGDSWGPRLEHILRNALLALARHARHVAPLAPAAARRRRLPAR